MVCARCWVQVPGLVVVSELDRGVAELLHSLTCLMWLVHDAAVDVSRILQTTQK